MALNLHQHGKNQHGLRAMSDERLFNTITGTPAPNLSPKDLNTMAIILESRHGIHAKDMAEFFASVHAKLGDAERCWAWGGVATMVEKRELARLNEC